MAGRKNYTVNSEPGLNVRAEPSRSARVLKILKDGEKIAVDNAAEAPDGWKALMDGGYVMANYLK